MSQDFIIKVRVTLAEHNKTDAWLADTLGISRAYMSDIMNGRRKPHKQIERINKALEELNKQPL